MSALVAGTNLKDAYDREGVDGIYSTRAGRTGALQAVSAGSMLGYMGAGAIQERSVRGLYASPLLNSKKLGLIGGVTGGLTIANEAHALDDKDARTKTMIAGAAGVPLAMGVADGMRGHYVTRDPQLAALGENGFTHGVKSGFLHSAGLLGADGKLASLGGAEALKSVATSRLGKAGVIGLGAYGLNALGAFDFLDLDE
jgi:hypothetical protein